MQFSEIHFGCNTNVGVTNYLKFGTYLKNVFICKDVYNFQKFTLVTTAKYRLQTFKGFPRAEGFRNNL